MANSYIGAGTVTTNNGQSSLACDVHANTNIGDLLVAITDDPTGAVPTGNGGASWVQLFNNGLLAAWVGRATSTNAQVYVYTVGTDTESYWDQSAWVLTFRGEIASGTLTDIISAVLGPVSTAAVTGNAQTTTAANDLMLFIVGAYSVKRTSPVASGGINAVVHGVGNSSNFEVGYNLDTGAIGLKSAPIITTAAGAANTYSCTITIKTAAAGGQAAQADWATPTVATSVSALNAVSVPVVKATWSAATVASSALMMIQQAAVAAWTTAQSTTSLTVGIKTVLDDFNRYAGAYPGVAAGSPWVDINSANQQLRVSGNQAGPLWGGGAGGAYWNEILGSSHYAECAMVQGSNSFASVSGAIGPWANLGPSNNVGTSLGCGTGIHFLSSGTAVQLYCNGTLVQSSSSISWVAGDRFRVEVSGTSVKFYINGILKLQGTATPSNGIYAGVAVGVFNDGRAEIDDFNAAAVPAAATAAWSVVSVATQAIFDVMHPATATWQTPSVTSSALLGLPTPATTAWNAITVSSTFIASANVSRAKDTYVYPDYAAFGGATDLYNGGTVKGRITSPGDRFIGHRRDIQTNDRIIFHVTNNNLLKSLAGPTTPIIKATLFIVPVKVMDYRYQAPSGVQPSGTMFNVRPISGTYDPATDDGMAATLGSTYTTVSAKPIWLSGGWHYDGVTRMSPQDPIEIDITDLYNAALTSSADLNVCLECVFSDANWVVELFGSEVPELRPRIEVKRLGTADCPITIESPANAATKITVGVPSGATLLRIQWGYDEQLTQPGGVRKFSTIGSDNCPIDNDAGTVPWGSPSTPSGWQKTPGEGLAWIAGGDYLSWWLTVPSTWTFPMLESSSRVYVEVEIDYGADGTHIFKRTFRVPQTPAPKLELSATTTYADWLDVRGPCAAPHNATGQAWLALVQKVAGSWQLHWMGEPGKVWKRYMAGPPNDVFDVRETWSALNIWNPDSSYGGSDGPGAQPDAAANTVTADDVSELYADPVSGDTYFLTIHQNGGQWDIRLKGFFQYGITNPGWYQGIFSSGYFQKDYGVLYTTTTGAKPDLKAAAVSREWDWRTMFEMDWRPPLFVAFVADNTLHVKSTTSYYRRDSYTIPLADAPTWTNEVTNTVANAVEATFMHVLTLERAHRLVLAIRTSSGNCWLGSRSDDSIDMLQNGSGGFNRYAGSWAIVTNMAFSRVWVSSPSLGDAAGSLPDTETATICLQLANSTIITLVPSNLSGKSPGLGSALAAHPGPDWACTVVWNLNTWAVSRWPVLSGYQALSPVANGGADIVGVSGTTLRVQSIRDVCMVSDEITLTLPGSASAIHVQRDCQAYEGTPTPIIVGTPATGPFYCAFVTSHCDISRLDLPTDDQRLQFTSGKLTTANFVSNYPDERTPGIIHKPGHNVFVMGWKWDDDILGVALSDQEAFGDLMNNAGYLNFHISGCYGETAKLIIYQTPIFGGAWINGSFIGMDKGPINVYQQEVMEEWPWVKTATWWMTYDAPSADSRRWIRLWQTDFVFDGDCNGGAYILITPVLKSNEVWISHDPTSNPESYAGRFAAWYANRPDIIKWADSNGKLLTGVGPNAALPVSQTGTVPP